MTREDIFRITSALANATLQEKVRTGYDYMPSGFSVTPYDLATLQPFFRMNVKTVYTFESGLKLEQEFTPNPGFMEIKRDDGKIEFYINPPKEYIDAWYEATDQLTALYKKIPKEKLYGKSVD